ncbi:MAG: methionyl-tRNA formyltransferase [Bryobacteraceae bacterium]|nr:methionyl-tRNA formyltransferase [Bryobacteraceae bacterium]
MRIAFLGTPEFAVPSLERLAESGMEIAAVLSQPDRPKGRGQKLAAPAVKEAALRLGLAAHQPEKVNRPEVIAFLKQLGVDAMAVVAYGKIIPQAIIDIPRLGIVNVHASLLPKYRGAAPIQWAVANGETVTGVCTMRIDAGLDTGDILLARQTRIGPDETAVELAERLAPMGAELLVETLQGLGEGRITPRKQDHSEATLAPMLTREDGRIDWQWPAARIHNRIRGFQPWPGAYTTFRGQALQMWQSRVEKMPPALAPGAMRPAGRRLLVGCGEGAIEVLELQLEGRKRMTAEAFINGQRLPDIEPLGE